MTSTLPATDRPAAGGAPAPRPARRPSPATVRDQRTRLVQLALFAAGAVLMPVGVVSILVGWYGVAHSHYAYDQTTYLISGGVLGLGLILLGGFLYFGAWLAKMAVDQREQARQLSDTMLVLADLVARSGPVATTADHGADLVVAGTGHTVHRRDCALIAARDDLRPVSGADLDHPPCRVCRPTPGIGR